MATLGPRRSALAGRVSPEDVATWAESLTKPRRPPPKRSMDWTVMERMA
jgi:hypothetical protein